MAQPQGQGKMDNFYCSVPGHTVVWVSVLVQGKWKFYSRTTETAPVNFLFFVYSCPIFSVSHSRSLDSDVNHSHWNRCVPGPRTTVKQKLFYLRECRYPHVAGKEIPDSKFLDGNKTLQFDILNVYRRNHIVSTAGPKQWICERLKPTPFVEQSHCRCMMFNTVIAHSWTEINQNHAFRIGCF